MSEVLVSRESEHVVVITLNRPEQKNALDLPTRKSLAGQFEALAQDDMCCAVVITGGPEVFAAGADLRMLAELDPAGAKSLNLARFWKPIADFPKPLIAAVNGLALGGGFELAMHADVIIAGRSAQFGLPEPRVGIMPGAGGTQRLVRAIGKFRAMHLLLFRQADRSRAGLCHRHCQRTLRYRRDNPPGHRIRRRSSQTAPAGDPRDQARRDGRRRSAPVRGHRPRAGRVPGALRFRRQGRGMMAFLEKRKPVFERR